MNRKKVLDIYIKNQIETFSKEEREEELYEVWSCDWSRVEGWMFLTDEIRESIHKGKFPKNYEDKNYDSVLLFKFRDKFKGFRNDYLSKQTGLQISLGSPSRLEACPCCGFRTIEERYEFEICTVCWWEDDGHDNNNADKTYGGPNYGLSLTYGRVNFIRQGIYDPERNDLIEIKDDSIKFEKGRFFEIQDDFLIELGTEWKVQISKM